MIFLDTCILIDYSKDKIIITEEDKQNYCFSSIVQLEFTTGALNKRELKKINKILSEFKSIRYRSGYFGPVYKIGKWLCIVSQYDNL